MILLDTNVISELMKKTENSDVKTWLDKIPPQQVFTSAITKAEIDYGISILPDGAKKSDFFTISSKVFKLFDNRILPFDSDSATIFAEIKSHRKTLGKPISYADAQIAAIARQNNLILATRNIKDFRNIEHLEIIDPWNLS